LVKNKKQAKLTIKTGQKIIERAIQNTYGDKKLLGNKEIVLSELKRLPVIDFEKQKELKDYVDDLIFALYFNVPIKKIGFEKAESIKVECAKNKFYNIARGG